MRILNAGASGAIGNQLATVAALRNLNVEVTP
jgi:hypothetical protein